jgi:hypothetical protein
MVDFSPAMMPVMGSHMSPDRKDKYCMPPNDINGLLFFQRREMVQNSRRSLLSLKLDFVRYQLDATIVKDNLPRVFHKDRRFDRIDASNIADEAYLGILQTLEACSPLVKYKSENPHATVLTSFMLCTHLVYARGEEIGFIEQGPTQHTADLVTAFFHPINSDYTRAESLSSLSKTTMKYIADIRRFTGSLKLPRHRE